jgi:asparagine synthase (glutamine-hydrolysing)
VCGILAMLSHAGPLDPERVARATDAMALRGPDGRGIWVSPDRRIALGHRRLAVMDPSGIGQPLANESEQIWAVVNGEFYGAESLRADLEARGHRFRTNGDSEVLLHLYEDKGLAALEDLRGEFAFVLWDAGTRTLLAARDRFGIKPLYYAKYMHAGEQGIVLASQAKALFFAAGVPAEWDADAFLQAASMQYPRLGTTLYRGVKQLEPGTMLIVSDGNFRIRRYWDLDYPTEDKSAKVPDARAVAEAFRERFETAVTLRLRADVPVAFQLSGGIDSAAVAAASASKLTAPIHCFTVSLEGEAYDETALAKLVAAHLGATLHCVEMHALDVARELPAAVLAGEGLCINAHLVAKYCLSRAVRDAGFKVVLTGEGSDEVLAGYAHLRADLNQASRAALMQQNSVSRGIMLPDGPGLSLAGVRERLGFVPTWLEAKASFGYRMQELLSPPWAQRSQAVDRYASALEDVDVPAQLAGRGPVEQALYLWSKFALESYILRTLGDGMEMAHSIEGRVPFLDHQLFEWLRTLPAEAKIRNGIEKAPLRDAMRGLLPEALVTRPKHPFLAPPTFSSSTCGAAEMLLDLSKSARALPFFDATKLEQRVKSLDTMSPTEQATTDPTLMFALSACILHQGLQLHVEDGA